MNKNALNKFLTKAKDAIDKYGTFNLGIMSEGGMPGYTYSSGLLSGFNHPEIIVFALSYETSSQFLNDIRERVRAGEAIQTDIPYEDLAVGFPCVFRPVDPLHFNEFAGLGMKIYNRYFPRLLKDYRMLQLFWPDKQKRFPWEAGYAFPRITQPLLYDPKFAIPAKGH